MSQKVHFSSAFKTLFLSSSLGVFGALLLGCGGEVHFVSPSKKAEPQTSKPNVQQEDTFRYNQASGRVIFAFVIFPRKNELNPTLTVLSETIPTFVQEFLALPHLLDELTVMSSISTTLSTPEVSQLKLKNENPGNLIQRQQFIGHFQNGFLKIPASTKPGDELSTNPVAAFTSSLNQIRTDSQSSQETWLHLVYLRHFESSPYTKSEQIYLQTDPPTLERIVRTEPFSIYKTFLHFVALNGKAESSPFFKNFTSFDRVLSLNTDRSSDIRSGHDFFHQFANEAHRLQSRLVLTKKPKLTTLNVFIGDKAYTRENFEYLPQTQELILRDSIQPPPQTGDEIKVFYEPI